MGERAPGLRVEPGDSTAVKAGGRYRRARWLAARRNVRLRGEGGWRCGRLSIMRSPRTWCG